MSSEEKLEIPAHIDGLDVISIADDAINYGGAKETVVPDTVKFIADNAFKESYSLEDIYLTKNVSYIGNSSFQDIKVLKTIIQRLKRPNNPRPDRFICTHLCNRK